MIIGRIYYPVLVLGYGRRVGIWTCGCKKKCKGCTSPELQDESSGKEISVEELLKYVNPVIAEADGVTISGGEPFDQAKELRRLIEQLLEMSVDDILVYTGNTYQELNSLQNEDVQYCLKNIAALVDGAYVQELDDGTGLRGSSNQRLYMNKYRERYQNWGNCKRKQQCIELSKGLVFIGLPEES